MTDTAPTQPDGVLEGHSGELAVAAARAHGVETMFTLSGAHVFPMYDGAVKADPPMRLLDVRHEQTAAFAAEATGELTRSPGFAVLTAGPGVTNGISAIAQAQFAGSPMVVLGGRAPNNRWGSGALQEIDQPPLVDTVTKLATTLQTAGDVLGGMDQAFAALLEDLQARGLLDQTLVVFHTEFGRTPKINAQGGRDHWGAAGSIFFAGGGTVPGRVIGATDRQAAWPVIRGHTPADVAATIYRALGIHSEHRLFDRQHRPLPVLPEGESIPGVIG